MGVNDSSTGNWKLKQIAKQVSLLNRLLELLRMQEEPEKAIKKFGWYKVKADGFWVSPVLTWDEVATIEEAWNHPITQKAWSDELVKVARELIPGIRIDKDDKSSIELIAELKDKDTEFLVQRLLQAFFAIPSTDKQCIQYTFCLEAILNRYGRSLSE